MPQDLATRERPVTERPSGPPSGPTSAYAEAGVDTQAADDALRGVLRQLAKTKRKPGLNYGYFASVIEFAGTGLALCTDGVGSSRSRASCRHTCRKGCQSQRAETAVGQADPRPAHSSDRR